MPKTYQPTRINKPTEPRQPNASSRKRKAPEPPAPPPRPSKQRTVVYDDRDDSPQRDASRSPEQEDSGQGSDEVEVEEADEEDILADPGAIGDLLRAMRAEKNTDKEYTILTPWRNGARQIARTKGYFLKPYVCMVSACHYSRRNEYEDLAAILKDVSDEQATEYCKLYSDLEEAIPALESLVQQTQGSLEVLQHVSVYLEKIIKQARSDDGGKVKGMILKLIPKVKDIPAIDDDLPKHGRGFHHLATARLLCPASLQTHFVKSPQEFCDLALAGKVQITADHFPLLLYPEDGYDPAAPANTLLQSPLLAAIYRSIMTGPRTAKAPQGANTTVMRWNAGKKSIAKKFAISCAIPESICSFAALCRFGLDSQLEWCEQDKGFVYEAFYTNLMQLFEDEEWAAEVIEWYNVEVFGPGHHDDSGRLLAGPSSLTMIAKSRVRRTRGEDAPTATSTSSTGASASTSGDTSSAAPAAGDHAPASGSPPPSSDGATLVDAPVPPAIVHSVVTQASGAALDASTPAPAAPVSAATEPAAPAPPASAAVVPPSAPPTDASAAPINPA